MKAEEVVQDLCNPTADQAEEEKIPNGCEAEEDIHEYI